MCAARRRRDDYDDGDLDIFKRRKPKGQSYWPGFIGVGIAACVVVGLACVGVIVAYVASPPPFLGEWDSVTTKAVKHQNAGAPFEANVPEATLFLDKDLDGGFGSFINEKGEEFHFTWSGHDKERKTIVFTMDIPGDTFWRDIASPATFTYALAGDRLTLTNGKESITFNKVH